MITGEFKANCDIHTCDTSIKLKSRTEASTKREVHSMGWTHDQWYLHLRCPECEKKKQKNSVKDLFDNIDDPIMDGEAESDD